MSEPRDTDFERDLARDSDLSEAYRARSAESPPAALDARILAAAHRAVGSRPQPAGARFFRVLRAPVAAAAIVLLSASLLFTMRGHRQMDLGTPIKQEAVEAPPLPSAHPSVLTDESSVEKSAQTPQVAAPAEEAASPPRPDAQPSRAERHSSAKLNESAPATESRDKAKKPQQSVADPDAAAASISTERERAAALPPASASSENARRQMDAHAPAAETKKDALPAAFPARDGQRELPAAAGDDERSAEAAEQSIEDAAQALVPPWRRAGMEDAPATEASPRPYQVSPAVTAGSPMEWIEEIRKLVRDGRMDDARAALARFRAAYPQHRLPEDLGKL